MYRSMMRVIVKDSVKALRFYQKAFDAAIIRNDPGEDETTPHTEIDVYGQVLAVSELDENAAVTGNTMQFGLDFGEGNEATVQKIYDALKEGANVRCPIGPVDWSPLMFELIDKYGVDWCVFV